MSSRSLSKADWIKQYASGTLQYAVALNTAYHNLYREERIAFTFGHMFRCVPPTHILAGHLIAEGDCHAFTEGMWQVRRRMAEAYKGDTYNGPLYIKYETPAGETEEGLGVIVNNIENGENLPIPDGWIVFAIISPVKNKTYTGQVLCL